MYHCFRLHRGQDLYEAVETYVNDHHIAAGAVVSGVGCVSRWRLRDAIVNTTAEIVLAEVPDRVFTRAPDSETGYDELVIAPAHAKETMKDRRERR